MLQLTSSRPHLQPESDGLILNITVTAPEQQLHTHERLPLDIAIALDVSSSMSGSKLAHAKHAAQRLVSRLSGDDTCSLVVFSSTARVIHSSTPMHERGRALLGADIEHMRAGGSTALHAGWDTALQTIQHGGGERGSVRRVFLLTDGAANEGITDPETLATLAAGAQQNGITTSVFGVGLSYNEQLLNKMATAGEGNCYHITEPTEIDTFFAQELDQLFTTTLRDVVVTVTLPAGVTATVVGDRNHRRAGQEIQIPLASMVSGETREAFLFLQSTEAALVEMTACVATLSGIDERGAVVSATQALAVADEEHRDAIDEALERRAAEIDAAGAMVIALERVRFDRAAASAAFDERAARFPLLARFGLYEQEKKSLPHSWDEGRIKRGRMRSKDRVNGSHTVLHKYESILASLIEHGASPESIAEARADLERMRKDYGL